MSAFVVSLDFELHWGVFDKMPLDKRGKEHFLATREVIPPMLALFEKYAVSATWATVGFLFAKNYEQLLQFLPKEKPGYVNNKLNPYPLVMDGTVGLNEEEDPYHFAYSLIRLIVDSESQEVSSHSFSHFYCLEKGAAIEAFEADIKAAVTLCKENFGITPKSFVFPRNQFNSEYFEVMKTYGFEVVRSNPEHWFWDITGADDSRWKRAIRLLDSYLPFVNLERNQTGRNNGMILSKGSRFLRPPMRKLMFLESLKMARIKREMTFCAKNELNYHLWWHPHNFAIAPEVSLRQLESILLHFSQLKSRYGFESSSMSELEVKS